jgi:hypothetical protein
MRDRDGPPGVRLELTARHAAVLAAFAPARPSLPEKPEF